MTDGLPELPPTVRGIARRRAFVVRMPGETIDRILEPLPDPIPYEGYSLGEVVIAWSGPINASGWVHAMIVGGPGLDLIFTGAVMDSVERAMRDSATVWRQWMQELRGER